MPTYLQLHRLTVVSKQSLLSISLFHIPCKLLNVRSGCRYFVSHARSCRQSNRFMSCRLAAGIAIDFTILLLWLGLHTRSPRWSRIDFWSAQQYHLNFSGEPAHHLRDGFFPTIEQQQGTIRIYHEHHSTKCTALQEALDRSKWQEAIAVQFDPSNDPSARFTHRHRLIWDIFSPFYNCPSQTTCRHIPKTV